MKAKDIIYFGLGAALLAKDKLEEKVKHLCETKKHSREDLEKFAQEAKERAEKEIKRIEETLGPRIKEEVTKLGLATKEDLEELKAHIKKLKS